MYRFRTAVWKWQGDSAWHFATVPFDVSDEIEARTAHVRHGFGSVKVRARIGSTTWTTSVFPDTKAEAYVLPVKAAVRKAEGIATGAEVDLELEVIEPHAL
jgi:Domain of unknown function (DUF1905)